VGYRETTSSDYTNLPAYLKTSNSGFYVNDLPGITFELIDDIRQEKTFNNYVQDIHNSEMLVVTQRFVDRQKKKLKSKELLSNITMLQRHNDLSQTISQSSRFVGYAITPRESKSININIKEVGFQSSASDTFTLYLFDPTQQTAISSGTIVSTGQSMTWTSLDWDVEFDRSGGTAGSTYLIGYFEDDLTATMYQQDWSDGQAHVAKRVTRKYAGISHMRIEGTGSTLPNMERLVSSLSCKTSGFDLRLNVKCDISDVLVDNITMFGEAVQHAVAIRYLTDALNNVQLKHTFSGEQTRESMQERLTDMEGMLYGGVIPEVGYRRGIIDNLAIDFSNLDAECFKAEDDIIRQVKW
ncbi:MAG: hypothetical protein V3V88_00435, partial [Dehalococcoidia bacterium]